MLASLSFWTLGAFAAPAGAARLTPSVPGRPPPVRVEGGAWDRELVVPIVLSAAGLGGSFFTGFILANRIGFPSHPSTPLRKLSWWFNTSMLQLAMLREAGIALPAPSPGAVQPFGQACPPRRPRSRERLYHAA